MSNKCVHSLGAFTCTLAKDVKVYSDLCEDLVHFSNIDLADDADVLESLLGRTS
jgi:hypothetical protein